MPRAPLHIRPRTPRPRSAVRPRPRRTRETAVSRVPLTPSAVWSRTSRGRAAARARPPRGVRTGRRPKRRRTTAAAHRPHVEYRGCPAPPAYRPRGRTGRARPSTATRDRRPPPRPSAPANRHRPPVPRRFPRLPPMRRRATWRHSVRCCRPPRPGTRRPHRSKQCRRDPPASPDASRRPRSAGSPPPGGDRAPGPPSARTRGAPPALDDPAAIRLRGPSPTSATSMSTPGREGGTRSFTEARSPWPDRAPVDGPRLACSGGRPRDVAGCFIPFRGIVPG
jgi:hypothetical protein